MVERTIQLMGFSFSWGLFCYSILKNWSLGLIFVITILSLHFSYGVYKDWFFLYFSNLWDINLKSTYLKKIIYYYNPRIYWILFVGIVFLFLYFSTNLLEFHWFLILLTFALTYYSGIYFLQDRMKEFNSLARAISLGNWSELNSVKIISKYTTVLYYRAEGISSYPQLTKIWSNLTTLAPASEKVKMNLIQLYYNNKEFFMKNILIEGNFNKFSLDNKISILESMPREIFRTLYQSLSDIEKDNEEIVQINITHLIKEQQWLLAELELSKLSDSEFKEDYLMQVLQHKAMQIQLFDYINYKITDFEISEDDYLRPSSRDKKFIKKYKMELYSLFDNRCCFNGSREEIEMDHFFIPKSRGGSFLMKHKSGFWVVNAIILNKRNNIIKNNNRIENFFDITKLAEINLKLKELNLKVNDEYSLLD